MSKYTIKSIMETGKSSPTYGTEYYVQFNEVDKAFPLWFKQAPEVGTEIEGEINGQKFKKIKKEYSQQTPGPKGTAPTSSRPAYKDNSLGMRIGMCINNAANYVNTLEFDKALTDREWAQTVSAYARALFQVSDDKAFTEAPEGSQETKEEVDPVENVQQVFGPVTPVKPK